MAYPLGYDHYTNQYFGNKNFILNCIDYMIDKSGLIALRSKQFQLRLLDAGTVKRDKLYWQIINTVLPIGLIIVFGVVYNYIRRRRFAA
jgi:ABC-2 type transport system permease protein